MSLRVSPLGASEAEAHLPDFFSRSEAWDAALHRRSDGGTVLIRTRWSGERREVARFAVIPGGLRALDRTAFEIDDHEVRECESYRARSGPNLHLRPIVLPARLRRGDWHEALEGARVQLSFVGRAELRLGTHCEERRVICLTGAQGEQARDQWLAEGVGEITLGPRGDAPQQWLRAWTGNDAELFGGVPEALRSAPMPELPEHDGAAPRQDLF